MPYCLAGKRVQRERNLVLPQPADCLSCSLGCLPQALDTPSAPSAFDEQPQTGIFRNAHNRGCALGTGGFANPMALEGVTFYPPIFIPLPEAFEGVHDCMLPLSQSSPQCTDPAERLQGESCMPDFRHVPDLVALELHHIHIGGVHALARGRAGATLTRMRARKDAVGTDVLPLFIRGQRLEVIASVRYDREQVLHPVRVLVQGVDVSQGLGLYSKRGIGRTVRFASLPSFSFITGDEELFGNLGD